MSEKNMSNAPAGAIADALGGTSGLDGAQAQEMLAHTCGGHGLLFYTPNREKFYITCDMCGHVVGKYNSRAEVISVWNESILGTLTAQPPPPASVAPTDLAEENARLRRAVRTLMSFEFVIEHAVRDADPENYIGVCGALEIGRTALGAKP